MLSMFFKAALIKLAYKISEIEKMHSQKQTPPKHVSDVNDGLMWDDDGNPLTLRAAAIDALSWLQHFNDRPTLHHLGGRNRHLMACAVRNLEKFLDEDADDGN